MKRLAGVGIILGLVGAFVLFSVLALGATWMDWVVIFTFLAAVCTFYGLLVLGGYLWNTVSKMLGVVVWVLTLFVLPPIGFVLLGSTWWSWFVVAGAGIAIVAVVLGASVLLSYATDLISGRK